MNINEYISNGIIESYVLGLADEEEQEEFERLCNTYPQLVAARENFEVALEREAFAGVKQPPQHVRTLLLTKIQASSSLQAVSVPPAESKNHTIPNHKGSSTKVMYFAAASVIAVLSCGWFLYRLNSQNNDLVAANRQLLDKFKHTDSTLNVLANGQSLAANKSVAEVHLTGAEIPVKPLANIYWDSASAEVYMVVKNLPALPPDKQYQLWARINGKPKSLGVFDATSDKVIFKMRDTKKAEAFAITVEPKGGNAASGGKAQAAGKAK